MLNISGIYFYLLDLIVCEEKVQCAVSANKLLGFIEHLVCVLGMYTILQTFHLLFCWEMY